MSVRPRKATSGEGSLTVKTKRNTAIRIVISLGAVILVAVRLIWPNLTIDAITLGLLIVALLPWASSLIESAKFPGGWEVKFRDVEAAGHKVMASSRAATDKPLPTPSYLEICDQDPNLALVGLRIEIEKRMRELAEKHQIRSQQSLMRLFNDLRRHGVLNDASMSGLQELVMAGNQAAHGATVEPRVAEWAFSYGPSVLSALDEELGMQ